VIAYRGPITRPELEEIRGVNCSIIIRNLLIKGLIELFRLSLPNYPQAIAEMAYTVERDILGYVGGRQDQYAAAFKGINSMEFSSQQIKISSLHTRDSFLYDLQLTGFLCYTGKTHVSSDLIREQFKNPKIDVLLNIKKITEQFIDRWEMENIQGLANLMHCSMLLKQQINEQIVPKDISEMYQSAMKQGAWGGRLLGAGAGGYLLFFGPFDRHQKIKQTLTILGGVCDPFLFDTEGIKIWKSRI